MITDNYEPLITAADDRDSSTGEKDSPEVSDEPQVCTTDILPTWAATSSLLIQCSPHDPPLHQVNSGIVASLLRRPRTDYGSL